MPAILNNLSISANYPECHNKNNKRLIVNNINIISKRDELLKFLEITATCIDNSVTLYNEKRFLANDEYSGIIGNLLRDREAI